MIRYGFRNSFDATQTVTESNTNPSIRLNSKRIAYCMVRLQAAEEQAAQYKKRARNTVIFYIIAESIWQIKDLILYYYS